MTTPDEFDYVIVGAGSAGCVLADRLSADGRHRVCVLEFGGSDRSMLIQMPAALSIPLTMPKYSWAYRTEPEPHLGGRRITCPRGKVLGGSSSINGLVYVPAATRSTSTAGRRWARPAGATATSYLISAGPSAARRAGTSGGAAAARWPRATAR
jgi:choline dehydrogenase